MQANALRMLQDNAKAQGSTPGNPRNSIADATESTDGYTVLTRSQISHRKATASIHLRSCNSHVCHQVPSGWPGSQQERGPCKAYAGLFKGFGLP